MGRTIGEILIGRGHTIAGKITIDNAKDLSKFNSSNTDIAIEFSNPESAYENINYCLNNDIPIVSGTTGWLEKKEDIEKLCLQRNGTFFYASNFSIGVNIFFQLNKVLARLMVDQKDYHTEIEEVHHTQKVDAPSGTAISLAECIIEESEHSTWTMKDDSKPDEIKITAIRKDPAPGTHVVTYTSEVDDIEIRHTAHSRKGFATGAVLVTEWLVTKKGVLTMDDFLSERE